MPDKGGLLLLPLLTLVIVRRVRLLRGQEVVDRPPMWASDIGPVLWTEPEFGEFLRAISPSLAAAVVAHCGAAALAGGSPVAASVLLAIAVAVPAGRWPMPDRAGRKSGWSVEAVTAAVLILWLLNWAARPGLAGLEARAQRPPEVAAEASPRSGRDLSGVILTLPIKPREKVLFPPPSNRDGHVVATMRPIRIEFDGVYWYFQAPDRRPRRNAKVVEGDPSRAKIRSTNGIPIQMEAHQRLPEQAFVDRYEAIVVKMRDADSLAGLVKVSLLLEGENGTEPLLLGTRVLEASRTRQGYQNRPAVDEELRFAMTPAAHRKDWAELVVRVEPERARALAGAHVTVLDFLLEP